MGCNRVEIHSHRRLPTSQRIDSDLLDYICLSEFSSPRSRKLMSVHLQWITAEFTMYIHVVLHSVHAFQWRVK